MDREVAQGIAGFIMFGFIVLLALAVRVASLGLMLYVGVRVLQVTGVL